MSRQRRRIQQRRRRHAEVTRRAGRVGGLAVAATLLSGAVAHAGTFTVTTLSDTGAGSLRDAITQANNSNGADTIQFSSSLAGIIYLGSSLPTITGPLTISGPGPRAVKVFGAGSIGLFSVSASAPTEIDGLQFLDGRRANGGAVDVTGTGSPLTLTHDTFYGDTATGNGGAIYADSGLTVSDSTFYYDTATASGGAIQAQAGASTIDGSTFYRDTATTGGAVAEATSSGATISGSTIVDNTASATGGKGGGVYIAPGDSATIDDSIVSGNTAASGADLFTAAGASAPTTAFSLFGTLSGSGISTPPSSDIVDKAPALQPFSRTEGTIGTLNPTLGSPVLDAGKAFGVSADERGTARPTDLPLVANATGGDGSDIGAVEATAADLSPQVDSMSAYTGAAGSTVTLTGLDFTGTTSVSFGSAPASFSVLSNSEISATVPTGSGTVAVTVTNAYGSGATGAGYGFAYPGAPLTVTTLADAGTGSLRDAINLANAGGAHEITFASGLSGAIDLASSLPVITNPVTIAGPGADRLTVDGDGTSGLFDLTSRAPSSISGLTISHGASAGVTAELGPLSVSGLDVTGNDARYGYGYGGGIYSMPAAGPLTVENSTISANTAVAGAGLYAGGSLTMIDSTVTANTVTKAHYGGAGIKTGLGQSATIVDSTIVANHVTGNDGTGGGIDDFAGSLTLEGSIVSGNTAASAPDISANNSTATASFSLIGNTTGSGITPDSTDIVGTDPLLGALGDNGGPTPTMLPQPGSPVLDAGNAFGLSTDERGLARTVDLPGVGNATGGDGTDIGAVETQLPAVTVVSTPPAAQTTPTSSSPAPTSPTPTSTGPTQTTTTTPMPSVTRVSFDNQQLTLTTPAAGVCTAAPVSVSFISRAIPRSKAAHATFLQAAFSLDKGVKHVRRVRVHGRVKTLTTYTPNVVTRHASSTERIKATKGTHTLKVVVTYRTTITRRHHRTTVTVRKTISTTLHIC